MEFLKNIEFKESYNKAEHDIANDFYIPAMSRSSVYDRLSGYFGSTIYIIAWSALKSFVSNGGRMRLVCSPCLSENDIEAIQKGQLALSNEVVKESLAKEIAYILSDEELKKPFEVLSWLISQEILEIKIAYGTKVSNIKRLFHDKVGIFHDTEGSAIMFRGSLNETFKGLSNDGNFESIDVFTNWQNNEDNKRIESAQSYFDKIWSNTIPNLTVTTIPPEIKSIITKHTPTSSWETLIDEIEVVIDRAKSWKAEDKGGRTPRRHQIEALDNWVNNNHRGILEHATGSGKTYTCLCAIRRAINEQKTILIFVPSSDLLTQWYEEVKETFKDLNKRILLCGGGNSQWRKSELLKFMTSPVEDIPKITIASMDTASMTNFISNVNQGDHLFVVADEVHRLGSPQRRKIFSLESGYRLGVSATPRRYGDPIGTEAIFNYFGGIIPPVFSLEDAIKAGVLTPYFYSPKVVSLAPHEQEEWNDVSKKIRERMARLDEKTTFQSDSYLQSLLLKRARIIKKAENKIALALEILKQKYKRGDRWIVYCEDINQLNQVVETLSLKAPEVDTMEYYANMDGDREATLDLFTKEGGVVVSIKCLDEGVDIPATTHAIILASSKNPREFIQRRGRVLRRSVGKHYAWIYDAIVVPDDIEQSPSTQIESLIFGELSRAIQFSTWSETTYGNTNLKLIANQYNLDVNKLSISGLEDE